MISYTFFAKIASSFMKGEIIMYINGNTVMKIKAMKNSGYTVTEISKVMDLKKRMVNIIANG